MSKGSTALASRSLMTKGVTMNAQSAAPRSLFTTVRWMRARWLQMTMVALFTIIFLVRLRLQPDLAGMQSRGLHLFGWHAE